MTTMIIMALITFNIGFLAGAFWVSAKNADAREFAGQDAARWLRTGVN